MEITEILKSTEKYHYLGCGARKAKIIGSSDSKKEAKKQAKKYLEPHWDDLVGTVIYRVDIRKSTKGEWNEEKDILIPAPILMEISGWIVMKDKSFKEIGFGVNSIVFIGPKYLKKTKMTIRNEDIKKKVKQFEDGKLKTGLMDNNMM